MWLSYDVYRCLGARTSTPRVRKSLITSLLGPKEFLRGPLRYEFLMSSHERSAKIIPIPEASARFGPAGNKANSVFAGAAERPPDVCSSS
jgi:hypothetical protein